MLVLEEILEYRNTRISTESYSKVDKQTQISFFLRMDFVQLAEKKTSIRRDCYGNLQSWRRGVLL